MVLKEIGAIIFFLSLAIFTLYLVFVYVPTISANPNDADALMNALWWGLGCGVGGTVGATLAKFRS